MPSQLENCFVSKVACFYTLLCVCVCLHAIKSDLLMWVVRQAVKKAQCNRQLCCKKCGKSTDKLWKLGQGCVQKLIKEEFSTFFCTTTNQLRCRHKKKTRENIKTHQLESRVYCNWRCEFAKASECDSRRRRTSLNYLFHFKAICIEIDNSRL